MKKIILLLVCLSSSFRILSQLTVIPSDANACNCSGALTYTTALASNADYTLYDTSDGILEAGSSADGTFTIIGLCPNAYVLNVIQDGETTTHYFNVATTTINPGNASFLSVCSTDDALDLNELLDANDISGDWTDPSFQVIDNLIDPSDMTTGWYTYSIHFNDCEVSTGIYIDFIQNANPGGSATYLICENYNPFFMTNFLSGSPDMNGYWIDADGLFVDGYYDPQSMNGQLFTYIIDNIEGCSPVYATLYVDENQIPNPGLDSSIVVCQGGQSFNMIDYLGGYPQAGGIWFGPNNTVVSGVFNPSTYEEGTYRYLVNALIPCPDPSAYLTITYVDENPAGESTSIQLCETDSAMNMFDALNGNPISGGVWTNPQGWIVDDVYNPQTDPSGDYVYSNPYIGCPEEASVLTVQLESLPNAGDDNSIALCESVGTINLNDLLSPDADPGGTWVNGFGVVINSNYVLPEDTGLYHILYQTNMFACPDDIALFDIQVNPDPIVPLITVDPSTVNVCNEMMLIGSSNEEITWSMNDVFMATGDSLVVSQSGNYVATVVNGCGTAQSDIDVTILSGPLSVEIIQDGNLLSASEIGVSYSWYLNNELIDGATASTYEAAETGEYSVQVTFESGCYLESNWILMEVNVPERTHPSFLLMPNPTNGNAVIRLSQNASIPESMFILDVTGKLVYSSKINSEQTVIPSDNWDAGVYFIHVAFSSRTEVLKMIVGG